jgi:hypothetical protein
VPRREPSRLEARHSAARKARQEQHGVVDVALPLLAAGLPAQRAPGTLVRGDRALGDERPRDLPCGPLGDPLT